METKRMAQEKEKWQLVYDTKRRLKLKTEMTKWKRITEKRSNRERKKRKLLMKYNLLNLKWLIKKKTKENIMN